VSRKRNPLLARSPESITHTIQARGRLPFGAPAPRKIWGLHVTPDESLAAWYAVRAAYGEHVGDAYRYPAAPAHDGFFFDWGIVFAINPAAFAPANEGIDPDVLHQIQDTADRVAEAYETGYDELAYDSGNKQENENEVAGRAHDLYENWDSDRGYGNMDLRHLRAPSLDTAFARSTFRFLSEPLYIDNPDDFLLLYTTLVKEQVRAKDLIKPEHRDVLDLFLSGTEGVQRVFHENVYVDDIVGVYLVDPPPWPAIDVSGDADVVEAIDSAGWITVREEELFEGTEGLVTLKSLWEREPSEWYDGDQALYHGTSLRTARKAFPDLMNQLLPEDPPEPQIPEYLDDLRGFYEDD
jgi:hypothetical protein